MRGRLWAEAKALAGLAESYARLAEREAARARAREAEEEDDDDGTARGVRAALAYLREEALRDFDDDEGARGAGSVDPGAGLGYPDGPTAHRRD